MRQARAAGFTLIEILVAMAIGGLLMAGIVQVFSSLKRTDRVAEALSRVQEAGRTALDTMAYDLRMTGYRGCADPAIEVDINVIATDPPTSNFVADSLRGADVSGSGWATSKGYTDLTAIEDTTATRQARAGSDVVSIMRASAESAVVDEHNNDTASVYVLGNPMGLAAERLALISDCDTTDIFRVSGVAAAGSRFNVGHADTQNVNAKLSKTYTNDNTQLMAFISNAYFVGDTGRTNVNGDPIYALYRYDLNNPDDPAQEIVEGVENLQITYGHEFINGNRRFVPADTAGLDMAQVTAVKLSVLVASRDRVLDADDTNVYPMEGVIVRPESSGATINYANDRRLRKVFNMTVNLRNRRVGS